MNEKDVLKISLICCRGVNVEDRDLIQITEQTKFEDLTGWVDLEFYSVLKKERFKGIFVINTGEESVDLFIVGDNNISYYEDADDLTFINLFNDFWEGDEIEVDSDDLILDHC